MVRLTLFFLLLTNTLVAERLSYTDSLEHEILVCKTDSIKVRLLNELAGNLNYEDNKKAFVFANDALTLSKKINYKKGLMLSYFTLGNIYQFQGKFDLAVKNAFQSLEISEELKDSNGIGDAHNALGLIYQSKREHENALNHFLEAVSALEKTSKKQKLARSLNNSGNAYMYLGKYEKALVQMKKSLEIREAISDRNAIADCYNDMGNVFYESGKLEDAFEFYMKCHLLKEEIGDREGIAFSALNLATLYKKKNNYSESRKYYEKSISFANLINGVELLMYNYEGISELYSKEGNYRKAYENHLKFSVIKDSILNIESEKAITEMQTKYDTEKKEKEILILEKKHLESQKKIAEKEASAEREKNKRIEEEEQKKLFGVIIFALAVVVGIIFYVSVKRKQNNVLLKKKNKEITEQKHVIEEKNKEILDSIEYAKRLQEAILPPQKLVKEYLNDSFILYKPKDIVAGDFYFLEPLNEQVIFAAADCTGHGVPGAMISVVCSNALNRAVKEFKLTNPGKILDKVRDLVMETFEKSENEVKDGMDISLCVLDLKNNHLKWSGANNPLWKVRKNSNVIDEIRADKQPIGNFGEQKPFTTHEIELLKGDTIYIFTDGFADQFGGEKGKKFKSVQMKEMILSIVNEPMEKQRLLINTSFESWKRDLEQVDDVCVIGIRI